LKVEPSYAGFSGFSSTNQGKTRGFYIVVNLKNTPQLFLNRPEYPLNCCNTSTSAQQEKTYAFATISTGFEKYSGKRYFAGEKNDDNQESTSSRVARCSRSRGSCVLLEHVSHGFLCASKECSGWYRASHGQSSLGAGTGEIAVIQCDANCQSRFAGDRSLRFRASGRNGDAAGSG
jgi:hypothetical protein